MIVTRDYILANTTNNGAWTKSQIEALGMTWPPITGWIDRACGIELSPEQRRIFERAEHAGINMKVSDASIKSMRDSDLIHLRNRLAKEIDLRNIQGIT